MRICVVGTGYVGLVVGTGLAETGNKVYCVDKDQNKIEQLKKVKYDFWPKTKYELVKLFKEQEKVYNDTNCDSFFHWTESIDYEIWHDRFIMVNIKPSDYDTIIAYETNNALTSSFLLSFS